jgi:mxaC protein
MNLVLTYPWALLLSPLALIPLFLRSQGITRYSYTPLIPKDALSTVIDWLIRLIAASAIAALVLALAGPYRREQSVERIGTGAQIVLLLDRSASMNENFSGRYLGGGASESKANVARRLLTEFIKRRQHDLFAMISFSTAPIYTLPLTQDREAVLAAIRAGSGRGRGITNIAPGMAVALDYFRERPVTGSRIILLVSDGAARIDADTQAQLRQWFDENQVMLYWIYLRNPNSASLFNKPKNPNEKTTPEYFLHQYFQTMSISYKAYEAENPAAVEQAIADIARLENRPIRYLEKIPREDLSEYYYSAAIVLITLLLGIKRMETIV